MTSSWGTPVSPRASVHCIATGGGEPCNACWNRQPAPTRTEPSIASIDPLTRLRSPRPLRKHVDGLKCPRDHVLTRHAQPLVQDRRVPLPEVGGESQVAHVHFLQVRVLADC